MCCAAIHSFLALYSFQGALPSVVTCVSTADLLLYLADKVMSTSRFLLLSKLILINMQLFITDR